VVKALSLSLLAIILVGCQTSVQTERQATATAFVVESMQEAMEVAEESALAICNLDFDQSPEVYVNNICSISTDLSCAFVAEDVKESWDEMQSQYDASKVVCEKNSSRMLETGEQYGKRVQYWRVNLAGVSGFGTGVYEQIYWLQIVEENGHWKFNRSLNTNEIAMYFAIEQMEQG